MLRYADLTRRAPTAARLVSEMIMWGDWQLYVQPPDGFNRRNRAWRGFFVDAREAERRRIAGRTLTLLVTEGYLRRLTVGRMWRPHGSEWRGRRQPLRIDVYVVTHMGREAYKHPGRDVDKKEAAAAELSADLFTGARFDAISAKAQPPDQAAADQSDAPADDEPAGFNEWWTQYRAEQQLFHGLRPVCLAAWRAAQTSPQPVGVS